jgi:hypothetical protein
MVHLQMTDTKEFSALCVKLWGKKIAQEARDFAEHYVPSEPPAPIPWDERPDVIDATKYLARLGIEPTKEQVETMMEIYEEISDMWSDY